METTLKPKKVICEGEIKFSQKCCIYCRLPNINTGDLLFVRDYCIKGCDCSCHREEVQ